jgi:hypothetical protein
MFQQIANHLLSEGQSLSPRTASALCDGGVLPSLELSIQRGYHSGWGGGIPCRIPGIPKCRKIERTGYIPDDEKVVVDREPHRFPHVSGFARVYGREVMIMIKQVEK